MSTKYASLIKTLRTERGLSQSAVAEKLGLSRQSYMAVERGTREMTLPEVLSAITYNAAKSLGLEKEIGSLEVGKKADLAFFDVPSYEYLLYHYGDNFCKKVIYSGKQA